MILTCPQCETRYQTDASQFVPAGRKVRCAKCGHVWHQAPPEPEIELVPVSEPQPYAATTAAPQRSAYAPSTGFSEPEVERPPPRRWGEQLGIAAGWAGLVAITLAIGWSAFNFRQEVAVLWPQSSSLYSAIGMKVNARGLEFSDVKSRHETQDGQSVLAVTGKLVNISAHELSVPPIRVTLTDRDKRELYNWSFQASVATLEPGQSVTFLTRMSSPPPGAKHLQLHLAERGE
jgi:predicted Zn finger-like uncharacterized protein